MPGRADENPPSVPASSPLPADVTEDLLLGQRLLLRQPAQGHRAGTDAVLLVGVDAHPEAAADAEIQQQFRPSRKVA
jgi:hypothetical protein